MQITIAPALPSETGELARIQKAAFKPLYERFRDDANPYLRGEEDIVADLTETAVFSPFAATAISSAESATVYTASAVPPRRSPTANTTCRGFS